MRVDKAMFQVANDMSDAKAAADAVIAGIKAMGKSGAYESDPVFRVTRDAAMRMESIFNREVK